MYEDPEIWEHKQKRWEERKELKELTRRDHVSLKEPHRPCYIRVDSPVLEDGLAEIRKSEESGMSEAKKALETLATAAIQHNSDRADQYEVWEQLIAEALDRLETLEDLEVRFDCAVDEAAAIGKSDGYTEGAADLATAKEQIAELEHTVDFQGQKVIVPLKEELATEKAKVEKLIEQLAKLSNVDRAQNNVYVVDKALIEERMEDWDEWLEEQL